MNNTNDKKDKNQLRVGAARICITPEPEYFPMEHFRNHMTGKPSIFSGKIAEDIFFRLILVENAHTRLVWAVLDLPGVPEAEEVTQLIADYAHIPESHVIYTCTHNHSGIYADNGTARLLQARFTATAGISARRSSLKPFTRPRKTCSPL